MCGLQPTVPPTSIAPPACVRVCVQVHEGSSAQSYGLAVARFARLPPEVIESAARRMAELEPAAAGAAGACGGSSGGGSSATRDLLLKFAAVPLEEGMEAERVAVALQQHAVELCQ